VKTLEITLQNLGDELVSNTIGVLQKLVLSDGTEIMQPMLSPLCFVKICRSSYQPGNELEKNLKTAIKLAINECGRRPSRNKGSSNDGRAFGNFILHAFQTRITRQISNDDPSSMTARFRFSDLLPVDISRSLDNPTFGPFEGNFP